MQPTYSAASAGGVVHPTVGDDVADGEPAGGLEDEGGFAEHGGLIRERLMTQSERTTSTLSAGGCSHGQEDLLDPRTDCGSRVPNVVRVLGRHRVSAR